MSNNLKKEHIIFGITCLVQFKGKKVTIHSFEFAKNLEDSYYSHNSYEERTSGKGIRIFLSAILQKRYNYDLERMFNDKEFMKRLLIQITDGYSNNYKELIIKNIKVLKSVEEVIREKASQEIVPDSVWC